MQPRLAVRQFRALVYKNWLIFGNNWFINLIRCLILPVLYVLFVAEAQHFFASTGEYGVGTNYRAIKTLDSELVGDLKFLWMDQSSNASLARNLINRVTADLPADHVIQVYNRTQLHQHCPENFEQVSQCFAAVVFQTLIYNTSTTDFVYQLRLDNGLYSTNVKNGKSSLETRRK